MPATPPIRTEPLTDRARTRRTVLKAGGTLLLSVLAPLPAMAAQILAVRVWPADDYTRVTLENDSDLKATHFIVKDPERLVVDIEGLELNPALKSLVAKIQSNDPYIKQVRVGQNRPNVVRLVFDLKEKVTPQVFTLEPAASTSSMARPGPCSRAKTRTAAPTSAWAACRCKAAAPPPALRWA